MSGRIPTEIIFLRDDEAPTLQGRLAAAIVRAVLESRARPGTRLPSSRSLASALGISRMTVTLVYQDLVSQGYLETLPRSGIAVAATVPHRRLRPPGIRPQAARPPDWSDWLSGHQLPRRVIRKPANWRDFRFPFIYGQADPTLFDHNAWRDCARRALGTRDFADLAADRYGADDPLLIDYICSNTLPRRGIHARPDEVLVTLGAQNALFLATELLARADRLAVTEEPGYPDFAETLRRAQSPTTFLPVDHGGLNPDDLPEKTSLVIITPSHHIPTGATMPLDRRCDLIARAAAQDFLIIEDDYDFEMSYLAPPAPALKSLDRDGRVVYVGSFSKSLFPGLRIGYMVGPAAEAESLVRRASRMLVAGAALRVPMVAVILRRGYGLGAQAMAGGSLHEPVLTVAWPGAHLGPMGLEGAVRLGMRKELEAISDVAEREQRVAAATAAAQDNAKALNAAMLFEIDDVIDPAETRGVIAATLAAARTGDQRARFVDTW